MNKEDAKKIIMNSDVFQLMQLNIDLMNGPGKSAIKYPKAIKEKVIVANYASIHTIENEDNSFVVVPLRMQLGYDENQSLDKVWKNVIIKILGDITRLASERNWPRDDYPMLFLEELEVENNAVNISFVIVQKCIENPYWDKDGMLLKEKEDEEEQEKRNKLAEEDDV